MTRTIRIPGAWLYTPAGRDVLGELTEGLGALGATPTFPLPRIAVRDGLTRVEGAFIGIAGKSQQDLGKTFAMAERVSLASRWTAGSTQSGRAYVMSQFVDLAEFKRSAGIRLAAIQESRYATDLSDSIKENIEQFTKADEWQQITGAAWPQIKSAADSMLTNLGGSATAFGNVIRDYAMPVSDTISGALGAFAPVLGGLAGAGIGLLVGAIFNGLFGGQPEEPQELHVWHTINCHRYRRVTLAKGAGCLITAECVLSPSGETGCYCIGQPYYNVKLDKNGFVPVNPSPVQTPIDLVSNKTQRGKWIAWLPGGPGAHQGQNRFPPSPPWYKATVEALVEGVTDYKGVASKLAEYRDAATGQAWQGVLGPAQKTRRALAAAGVGRVNIDTLMWLYWFEPLPEEFGQVVPMSTFQSTVGANGAVKVVSYTMPEPNIDYAALRESVNGGKLVSKQTLGLLLGLAGAGFVLLSD